MLTTQQKTLLYDQLEKVVEQFMNTRSHIVLHAVLHLVAEAVDAMLELDASMVDVGDDACCGPSPVSSTVPSGSEVRCPHCNRFF